MKVITLNRTPSHPSLFAAACIYLIGSFAGCGGPTTDYAKLGLVEVSGTVTLDGDPIEGAAVYFYEEDQRYCFGVTDADGRYQMMLNSEKSGVTTGEKLVKISTTSNPLGESADGGMEEEDPDAKPKTADEKIPPCYNKKSELRVTVSESDSSMDFDLQSNCSTTSAS